MVYDPQTTRRSAATLDELCQQTPLLRRLTKLGKNRIQRVYQARQSNIVLQDGDRRIFAGDADFARFRRILALEASAHFPAVKKDGFLLDGAPSDFSALLSVSGVKMSASNLPRGDNQSLLEEKGIPYEPDPLLRDIASAVLGLMIRSRELQAVTLARASSMSIPYFTSAMPIKQRALQMLLAQASDVRALFSRQDTDQLIRRYGIVFLYLLVERGMADGGDLQTMTPKERKVVDPTGREIIADKVKPVLEVTGRKAGFAMRNRTAYAPSGLVAYLHSMICAGYRDYLNEYAFTWKHRSFDHIAEKLAGARFLRGFDATQMDQYMPEWFVTKFTERVAEISGSEIVGSFLHLVNKSGYLAPSMAKDWPLVLEGDILNPQSFVGLASGRADNPDLGKAWMISVYIDLIFRLLAEQGYARETVLSVFECDSLTQFVDNYLRGFLSIQALNMGDDHIFIFAEPKNAQEEELHKKLREAMDAKVAKNETLSPWVLATYEDTISFLGGTAVRVGNSEQSTIRFIPNPVSFLVNFFCPERGIDSHMRRFWAAGRLLANEYYRSNPLVDDVWRLTRDVWNRTMDANPIDYILNQEARKNPIRDEGLRDVDVQALLNPASIHYKVDINDLSPEVRRELVSSFTPDEVATFRRNIFGVL